MGWSSWSFLRKHPTAASVEAQARALKSSGLAAHGYRYVNVDDFWMACDSHGPEVDADGRWIPDRAAFPGGIVAVARQVHAEGLKFGLHVTPGIPANAVRRDPDERAMPLGMKSAMLPMAIPANSPTRPVTG